LLLYKIGSCKLCSPSPRPLPCRCMPGLSDDDGVSRTPRGAQLPVVYVQSPSLLTHTRPHRRVAAPGTLPHDEPEPSRPRHPTGLRFFCLFLSSLMLSNSLLYLFFLCRSVSPPIPHHTSVYHYVLSRYMSPFTLEHLSISYLCHSHPHPRALHYPRAPSLTLPRPTPPSVRPLSSSSSLCLCFLLGFYSIP